MKARPRTGRVWKLPCYASLTMRVLSAFLILAVLAVPLGAQHSGVPADLTPILIPLAHWDLAGANGALWRTEIFVRTPEVDGSIFIAPSPLCPNLVCGAGVFPPGQIIPALHWIGRGPMLVQVETAHARQLQVGIRVFDGARMEASAGTTIPAVPITEFRNERFVLLNLPSSNDTRGMTRLYAYPPSSTHRVVRVRYLQSGSFSGSPPDVVAEHDVHLDLVGERSLDLDHRFLYAELPMLDGRTDVQPLHIEIVPPPGMSVWAMYSATNVLTHHVTVVTP